MSPAPTIFDPRLLYIPSEEYPRPFLIYTSIEGEKHINKLLEDYMYPSATKKQVTSFVRTLGGEARYSGKKKTMYLSGIPFESTKSLIMESFPRLSFSLEPKTTYVRNGRVI